jgi:ubiquinone/menaquinone biosynthesis C-methylase UbiE
MSNISSAYLHGFSSKEQHRLLQQAHFIAPMIYPGMNFNDCERILEIGSGVGAQTELLLRMFPNIHITCVDMNDAQLERAAAYLSNIPHAKGRYILHKHDAHQLDFADSTFDGVFLCWVLEHVAQPRRVLTEALRVIRSGAKLYANEVMNSSFFIFPHRKAIWDYWQAYNCFQTENGGDPHVGSKLGGFLLEAGFNDIQTVSKCMHFDQRDHQGRIDALHYWRDLLLSGARQMQESRVIPSDLAEKVHEDFIGLERCDDAVIYYAFMQASARKP